MNSIANLPRTMLVLAATMAALASESACTDQPPAALGASVDGDHDDNGAADERDERDETAGPGAVDGGKGDAARKDAGTSPATDDGSAGSSDASVNTDAGAAPVATTPQLVWVWVEANGFPEAACGPSSGIDLNADIFKLTHYLHQLGAPQGAQVRQLGSNPGLWTCKAPTSMYGSAYIETPASAFASLLAPQPAFQGQYVTIPVVTKGVASIDFHYFVQYGAPPRDVDDAWVRHGTSIQAELSFLTSTCVSFPTAKASSPKAAQLSSPQRPSQFGFDMVLHFTDGTTQLVGNAEARNCASYTQGNIP